MCLFLCNRLFLMILFLAIFLRIYLGFLRLCLLLRMFILVLVFVSSDPVDDAPVKMKRPVELIYVDPPAPAMFGVVCSSAGSPFPSHADSSSSLGVPAPSNHDLDLRYIL